MTDYLDPIRKALEGCSRALIAPHVNPDGDALGSMAGLAHILERMGKEVRLYLPAPLPKTFEWLPLPWPVASGLAELAEWTPDLVVCVDCGAPNRAGAEMEPVLSGEAVFTSPNEVITLNIDHHLGNTGFAKINWVAPKMSSTGEMVGMVAEHCGLRLDGDLGEAVYLSLVSDTGSFTFANTSASCLAMASRILSGGLDLPAFSEKYENTWSIDSMRLWGNLMSGINLHCDGQIASCSVSRAMLEEHRQDKSALEGFVSWLRRISTVRIAIFVREEENGTCKASLRSATDIDVRSVAARFGGGGHKVAAGVELALSLKEAEAKLVQAASELLGCA